ncbi:MAG TPA: hydrogenase maturation protease [Thermoplasmata archaeon]|nr:hydrogenase maturation protease [Thermoplasmata archaeon]
MSEAISTDPRTPASLPLVIGLGNEHRGDDASGLEVVRALRSRLEGTARVEECTSGGIALLDLWRDVERVVVVDAVRSGAPPGTVHRIEPRNGSLSGHSSATSTHGLSLAEAVGLASGLGCLPAHLVVYGIEAGNLEVGVGCSAPVTRGVQEAAARILAELRADTPTPAAISRSSHA